ncbi:MAG: two-component system response regulator [Nitrospirae bacterium RIFCSPHIGHO2_02_FULL_40_19]|nr:MAG: two-component system response regulator [Nitrospirae bacterium RIFCSPHIGHO2_02_FULL_40_19]
MKSVLVVDDSSATRSLITSMLEDIGGIDVFESSSGFEALKILPRQPFELIVADINMPDINGFELVSFVKNNEKYKNIPVIFVSTERNEEEIKNGMSLGASAYMTKPFNTEEFHGIVKKALSL